ncbi:MAG: hypothetical protein ACRCV9_03560 [Burkholderiaceae bacterium]
MSILERAYLEPPEESDGHQEALDAAHDRCIEGDKDALHAIGEALNNLSVKDWAKVESFGDTFEQALGELIIAAYTAGKTTPLAKLLIDHACEQLVEKP